MDGEIVHHDDIPRAQRGAEDMLDIGFPNGNLFLDRVEELLKEQCGVTEVIRRAKPSPARPAKKEVREELVSQYDAIVEALSS